MKVCDVVQFYSPLSGGVKRYIRDKSRFLADEPGIQHLVIVPAERDRVRHEGRSRVYEVASPRLIGSQSYRVLLARSKILEIIEAARPDLIEVGDPYRSAWIALEAGRRLRVPVVAFYHSDYPRALGRTLRRFGGWLTSTLLSKGIEAYLRRLYNRMDATVVTTRRTLKVLERTGLQRLVHIPLGTDPEVFHPRASRQAILRELNLPPDAWLMLYVGRLAREKNVRQLIAMMNRFSPADGKVHLLLVGDGELRQHVQARAQTHENLTWLPYCEDSERLAALYSAADLFVHAGTSETFGLVSLEAQACGTRVLAVRGGGLDESIAGEYPLVMAEEDNAASLAEAVRRIRRLGETEAHRQRRRERIINDFSWQYTYRQLTALYRHLEQGSTVESLMLPPGGTADALSRSALCSRLS